MSIFQEYSLQFALYVRRIQRGDGRVQELTDDHMGCGRADTHQDSVALLLLKQRGGDLCGRLERSRAHRRGCRGVTRVHFQLVNLSER